MYAARGHRVHAGRGISLGVCQSIALVICHPDGRFAQVQWQTGANDRWAAQGARVWRVGDWPVRVAFTAGKNGAYTIVDWVEGKDLVRVETTGVPATGAEDPQRETDQEAA